jgi:hypothetical protein
MLLHFRRLYFLTLLATLLTVSASGDDFYIVRIAFPLESPAQTLPLDDPNTDFLSARKPVRLGGSQESNSASAPLVANCFRPALLCAPIESSTVPDRIPPLCSLNTPLLC